MHLDVVFLPAALGDLSGRTGVVIDVLRATTTIITALSNGCPAVIPVDQPEEAIALANRLGRDSLLVGGERKGLKVEGFDLGNSPLEYEPEVMAGRKIIMCTTNGTRTIGRATAAQAHPVLLAAFLNAPAMAAYLLGARNPATLVCAGREEAFSMEDSLCAGLIAAEILRHEDWVGTDGARAAAALWEKLDQAGAASAVEGSDHGRYLSSIGLGRDVAFASRIGASYYLPVLREGCLVANRRDE